jgi:hypothetical protein
MPPSAARQNEYFVPRDGIDREVITSDICRYLGNDALVRPGTYEVWLAPRSSVQPPPRPHSFLTHPALCSHRMAVSRKATSSQHIET